MTIIDLVTFGPILKQLDALERDLLEQHRQTQAYLETALERQRSTAQQLLELKAALRVAADEHGRAWLAAGDLHRRR